MSEIGKATSISEIHELGAKQSNLSESVLARLQRGMDIAKRKHQILQITDIRYVVKSQKTNGEYQILLTERKWMCSCPDHTFRGVVCKHMYAAWIKQNGHFRERTTQLEHENHSDDREDLEELVRSIVPALNMASGLSTEALNLNKGDSIFVDSTYESERGDKYNDSY